MSPSTTTLALIPAARRAAILFIAILAAAAWLTVLGPSAALAKGGGDDGGGGGGHGGGGDRPEVRVAGSCGRGATSKLKLKADDGAIEAEFEVHGRAGAKWRVVFVQENRIAWRGRARTVGASRSFSIERRLGDYPGPDHITARAVGPRGITCQASAALPG
jgi:hypothetical protein